MQPDEMGPARLIVFDCDGVLIDSEIVVCRLVGRELTRAGYPITTEQVIERFAGRPEREMIADVEADWGRPVPDEYFDRYRRLLADAYAADLRAVPGVADVLRRVRLPVCVASSSDPAKLRLGLETAGLYDRFAPDLVSASYVAHGKPAPDVFVYAAGWMRTPVDRCVVVEDSIPGTRAARAAGMRVFGFTGGSHCPPGHAGRLIDAGAAHVLTHIRELETLLPEAFAADHDPAGSHATAHPGFRHPLQTPAPPG